MNNVWKTQRDSRKEGLDALDGRNKARTADRFKVIMKEWKNCKHGFKVIVKDR